jgi:hypothetical protein
MLIGTTDMKDDEEQRGASPQRLPQSFRQHRNLQ